MSVAILRFALFLPLILCGFWLVNQMERKDIRINRWWFGLGAFVSAWVPSFLPTPFENLRYGGYILCALCAVIFFEKSRRLLETRIN